MIDRINRFNVSVDCGFVKESDNFCALSSNAKVILHNLLAVTKGDLVKTAKFLDSLLNETQTKIQSLTNENEISDDDFFRRLTELKLEHKDTLDIIERLYMSSTTNKDVNKTRSESEKCRSNTDYRFIEPFNGSFEDKKNTETFCASTGEEFYEKIPSNCDAYLQEKNDLFSLKEQKTLSAVNHKHHTIESDTWKHHITVPEPFEMTKRDEILRDSRKQTVNLIDKKSEDIKNHVSFHAKPIPAHVYLPLYDKMVRENELRREAVKAYSQDILKSTEKPFNFTLREKLKREQNDFTLNLTNSKFLDKKFQDTIENKKFSQKQQTKLKTNFHDTLNLPKHLYENRFERLQENEILNEVKRQLRAQRLLQSASLPAGMEERQHRLAIRKTEREIRDKRLGRLSATNLEVGDLSASNKNKRTHSAPNFKQLHWKSDKALRTIWKPPPEPTRPKPFKLHTSERASSVDRVSYKNRAHSINKLNKSVPENSDEKNHLHTLRLNLNKPPPIQARASLLREDFIRKSIEKSEMEARRQKEAEISKKRKVKETSQLIRSSVDGHGLSPKKAIEIIIDERKKELIKQDQVRKSEYKREIEEMNKRIAHKPLLVTRQKEILARKRAEAKFLTSIRDAGLDPEELLELKYTGGENILQTNFKSNSDSNPTEIYDPNNHFGDLTIN